MQLFPIHQSQLTQIEVSTLITWKGCTRQGMVGEVSSDGSFYVRQFDTGDGYQFDGKATDDEGFLIPSGGPEHFPPSSPYTVTETIDGEAVFHEFGTRAELDEFLKNHRGMLAFTVPVGESA